MNKNEKTVFTAARRSGKSLTVEEQVRHRMKKTVTIQIGNSDDKLKQAEWGQYIQDVKDLITCYTERTHFFGSSSNWEEWQNVCWVFEIDRNNIPYFYESLRRIRNEFSQESVAVVVGDTEFI